MESPFPGMDPYLEAPARWKSIHTQLISLLPHAIRPQLPSRYLLSVEERVYMSVMGDDVLHFREPDLAVLDQEPSTGRGAAVAVAAPAHSTRVRIPAGQPVRERFLEVRDAEANEELVTVLELLSPTNKLSRSGRDEYLLKRGVVMASRVNLVEVDLLRAGLRMPMEELADPSDYGVLVMRSPELPWAHWIGFDVEDPFPAFPVPLRPGDHEPMVALRPLLDQICADTLVLRRIDYTRPPNPPLARETAAWADALLREKGLR